MSLGGFALTLLDIPSDSSGFAAQRLGLALELAFVPWGQPVFLLLVKVFHWFDFGEWKGDERRELGGA